MKKVLKWVFIIIILVGLVIGGVFVYKKLFKKEDSYSPGTPIEVAKKLDSISGFDYVLYDDSTELYKSLYYELKEILETEEIDYAKYAETISKMFIADFYTLSTKVTNQDIGGLDFIHSSIKENFKLKASDTLYKYIESNVYGDREQKLPEVKDFVSCTSSISPYKYNDNNNNISISDENSYVVKLTWSYKEDLKYQKSAVVRLVHEDKVLSIVSVE